MPYALRGPWPAGLIGMLALVLGVERFVAKHDARFTTHHASAWKRSGESVEKAARCGLVALGDSLVKHGFVSPVVEEASGLGTYNLAIPKGMFPAHDFLLRRLLKEGARPRALVVDGEMLLEDPYENARIWPELITLSESVELALAGSDSTFFGRMALAKLLPSFKSRHEVGVSVLAALDGKIPDETLSLPVLWRNWKRNAGSHVYPDRNDPPGTDPRLAELRKVNARPADWPIHPVNHEYVIRFLDRAQVHNIPVFWLLPPYHPEVEFQREAGGRYGKYVGYLQHLAERYKNLTVVDGRGAGYPPETLFDYTHLSRTGALTYSATLGRLIGERLNLSAGAADNRWVKLPRFDPVAASAIASRSPVEDQNASGRALALAVRERDRLRAEASVGLAAGSSATRNLR